ncbi:hypothetical protein [Plesiomonas sp. PI-19]|uniref:hypothetical protein n=1 Tax=Plesiomonas sp. PI-19 TaxID=2898798 RepID=UPI001F1D4653|nr:hypothetical protein [Plesiomonas sp. PI-19]MCE5165594.1 hypothetical protein [Plesiomonas sp. PI-19]
MINRWVFVAFVFRLLVLFFVFILLVAALLTIFSGTNYASVLFDYVMPKSLSQIWGSFINFTPEPFFQSAPVNRLYDVIVRIVGAVLLLVIANVLLVAAIWFDESLFRRKSKG